VDSNWLVSLRVITHSKPGRTNTLLVVGRARMVPNKMSNTLRPRRRCRRTEEDHTMNTMHPNDTCTAHMRPMTEEELEAQAIRELERLERARNAKRSGYQPKQRRRYVQRQ